MSDEAYFHVASLDVRWEAYSLPGTPMTKPMDDVSLLSHDPVISPQQYQVLLDEEPLLPSWRFGLMQEQEV